MIQNRTEIGKLFKNRTSKTFELEPDVGVKGGVLQKKSLRPHQILPLTNRMKSKQLYGGLKGRERETLQQKIRPTRKHLF